MLILPAFLTQGTSTHIIIAILCMGKLWQNETEAMRGLHVCFFICLMDYGRS